MLATDTCNLDPKNIEVYIILVPYPSNVSLAIKILSKRSKSKMSIINKNPGAGADTDNTQSQPKRTEQAPQQNTLRGGIASINARMYMGNSRSQQQNVAKNVDDALIELTKVGYSGSAVELIFLDNSVARVALSATLLLVRIKDKVIVSTVLIEGSETTHIKPIRVEYPGIPNIELQRPATDLYDNVTTAAVEELVRSAFPGEAIDVIDVGANIVPTEVTDGRTVQDLIKSEELKLILFFAVNNLFAKQIQLTGDTDRVFNVGWAVTDKQSRVRANIDKNPAPVYNAAGLPVRADVAITLSSTTTDSGNSSKFDAAQDLTVVTGYMDLTYVDPRDAAQLQSQKTGVIIDPASFTQSYLPRFVITRADSLLQLVTPELSLLAIATTPNALSRDNAWIGLFAPKYGRKSGSDLSDVGALGFEALHLTEHQVPARIDVKSDSFASNPANLVDFITTAMFQNVAYSMDILECSDLGAIDSMYLAAAAGNVGATNAVIAHADALTNGHFSAIWTGGPIAYYNEVIVPIGYYDDKDGVRQDLRTYDYLAMLNTYGASDASIVEKFAENFDRTNTPSYYRAANIKDILVATLGSSVTVKGFAHRIDWNPNFLTTLITAIANAGLVVESNSIGAYSANSSRRGNVGALDNAIKYQNLQGFMNYGNNNFNGTFARAQFHNPYNQ
jgi:hypothetical protein